MIISFLILGDNSSYTWCMYYINSKNFLNWLLIILLSNYSLAINSILNPDIFLFNTFILLRYASEGRMYTLFSS